MKIAENSGKHGCGIGLTTRHYLLSLEYVAR
jgi:hypothetical protein